MWLGLGVIWRVIFLAPISRKHAVPVLSAQMLNEIVLSRPGCRKSCIFINAASDRKYVKPDGFHSNLVYRGRDEPDSLGHVWRQHLRAQ